MITWNSSRMMAAANALAAALVFLLTGSAAGAQSLSVLPVNIFFPAGQKAATLTITNQGKSETAVQIRAYGWNQQDGNDQQLTGTDAVMMSPPLATIAPGASQVVRLILRQTPQDREATYRILVDQIPPPAEPGIIHIVLRLSIPVFAMPAARALPHLRFHTESEGDKLFLVGSNDGLAHELIRDIVLTTSDGRQLKEDPNTSPYILAGVTRRWPIAAQGSLPLPSEALRLTAHSNAGAIDEQVHLVSAQ
jgi:fimbrial chaperone protein